jgi:beta-glucosidase
LKNDSQLLPLKKSGTIAVVGPLASSKADMLGTWSMGGSPDIITSILDGIKNATGKSANVLYAKGSELTDNPLLTKAVNVLGFQGQKKTGEPALSPGQLMNEAVQAASKADVIVAVLGEPAAWSGEASSMAYIGLQNVQQDLLKAMLKTGKPVVLVLVNGRPMTLPWENDNVNAILETWALGTEAGNAVADVIFGDVNPSGRLSITVPGHSGQIPAYYNHKPSKDYWLIDRKGSYIDMSPFPLYEFGFGLSYTTFKYENLKIAPAYSGPAGEFLVSADITNTGSREGSEVVQLYIDDIISSLSTPSIELKGFQKIHLNPGEKKTVNFRLTHKHLSFLDRNLEPVVEPGMFRVMVGSSM